MSQTEIVSFIIIKLTATEELSHTISNMLVSTARPGSKTARNDQFKVSSIKPTSVAYLELCCDGRSVEFDPPVQARVACDIQNL